MKMTLCHHKAAEPLVNQGEARIHPGKRKNLLERPLGGIHGTQIENTCNHFRQQSLYSVHTFSFQNEDNQHKHEMHYVCVFLNFDLKVFFLYHTSLPSLSV